MTQLTVCTDVELSSQYDDLKLSSLPTVSGLWGQNVRSQSACTKLGQHKKEDNLSDLTLSKLKAVGDGI